jgi:multicomponent Na+:H+ antiporter subunit E
MLKKIIHALLLFSVLFGTWLVLSGVHGRLFLFYGAASAAIATLMALRMNVVDKEGHPFHLAFTAPLYWLWLLREMILSALRVTRAVWSPDHLISPGFARVRSTQDCDLGRTIFANSITLTPGTVCVDIEEGSAYIHALEQSAIDALNRGEMDRRVARLTTSSRHHGAKA